MRTKEYNPTRKMLGLYILPQDRSWQMKKIQEIFGNIIDETSSINDLVVEDIKYSQKTSTAICNIQIDKKINPLDLFSFVSKANEEYAVKNFKVKLNCLKAQVIDKQDVSNVIQYIKQGLPYLDNLFVASDIFVDNNNIKIQLEQSTARFFKNKKS